jgi:hypothetical protein
MGHLQLTTGQYMSEKVKQLNKGPNKVYLEKNGQYYYKMHNINEALQLFF